MNLLTEFALVVFVYIFSLTYIMKRAGGREMAEMEKEIKKLLEKAKKGDKKAFSKLNKLNAKRMRMIMRTQLYLFPFILIFIYFIKRRYAELTAVILGRSFGWLGLFIIFGIAFSMICEPLVKKLLGYS